jgi:Phage terminase, small subunit
MAFWQRVQAEFVIGDAGGIEILAQLCAGIDRAESLAEIIAAEGEVIRTRTGALKSHPAVRDEISARQFVLKAISKLGIDLEPQKAVGRPPRPFGWTGER